MHPVVETIDDHDHPILVVHLVVTRPMNCPHCTKVDPNGHRHMVTTIAPFEDVPRNCQISHQIKVNIINDLLEVQSMKRISQLNGVSTGTVQRILHEMDRDYGHPYREWLPANLAMDDFKAGKMTDGGMSMLLMNAQDHRVLDIFISRKSAKVETRLDEISISCPSIRQNGHR